MLGKFNFGSYVSNIKYTSREVQTERHRFSRTRLIVQKLPHKNFYSKRSSIW